MKRITKNKFYKFLPGEIFASGETTPEEVGLGKNGYSKEVYWIAVKGKGKDWAILYAWSSGEKFIRDYGDRLRGDENIRKLVDVDDAVLALYQK